MNKKLNLSFITKASLCLILLNYEAIWNNTNLDTLKELDLRLNTLSQSMPMIPIDSKITTKGEAIDVLKTALEKSNVGLTKFNTTSPEGYLVFFIRNKQGEDLFVGKESHKELNDLVTAEKDAQAAIKQELASDYKIHLMPKSKQDLIKLFVLLFNELLMDVKLQTIIDLIKFRRVIDFTSLETLKSSLIFDGRAYPIVVIYIVGGKQSAEYLLNKLISLYKNMPGANICPRFNTKINSLIYYAQGNGDDKMIPQFKSYFDLKKGKSDNGIVPCNEGMVFYESGFEGGNEDYSLNILPENEKYLEK